MQVKAKPLTMHYHRENNEDFRNSDVILCGALEYDEMLFYSIL